MEDTTRLDKWNNYSIDCKKYTGMSLMCVVFKVYERIIEENLSKKPQMTNLKTA